MKNIIFAFLLITVCNFNAFSQKTSKIRTATANFETKPIEREKFDPTRNAADELNKVIIPLPAVKG